jgi:hypothetical protein
MSGWVWLGRLAVVAVLAAACTAPNPSYAPRGLDAGPGRDATGGPDGGGAADTDAAHTDARPALDTGPALDADAGAPDARGDGGAATLLSHWAFDEGSGTTVADRQGGHDATLNGGVTWLQPGAPALPGNPACLAFDGIDGDGGADVTGLAGLDQPLSLAVWVWTPMPSGTPRKTILTLIRPGTPTAVGIQLGLQGLTPAVWYYGDDNTTTTLVFPSSLSAQTWHHLAYVHESGRHTLYVDGVRMATASRAPPSTEAPTRLRIATYGGSSQHFPGRLDDLRLYRGALTAADAAALAAPPR